MASCCEGAGSGVGGPVGGIPGERQGAGADEQGQRVSVRVSVFCGGAAGAGLVRSLPVTVRVWALGGAGALLVCVLLIAAGSRSPGALVPVAQSPGAPTITTVTAGDGSLVVAWSAPADVGGSPVTAYDLRHIVSSSSDKSDANWTVLDGVWDSGTLAYTVTGLLGGVAYDVQVRAVNTSGDGAWSATMAGTPRIGAPVVGSVAAGDAALTVVWSAPAGVPASGATAYDLRYIMSDSTDKSDAQWTVVNSVWTAGRLQYVLVGLTNGTGYDVQIRAVTTSDGTITRGAWSGTSTGTPAEHGDTAATATTLTLTTLTPGVARAALGGKMQTGTDVDYFKFVLSVDTGVFVHTSGSLDTHGELYDSSQTRRAWSNDSSFFADVDENFFIARTLPAGTYYVKVTGNGGVTGSYVMHAETIDDTDWSGSQVVEVDGSAHGIIHGYGDLDRFKFTLTQPTDVIMRTTGYLRDTMGILVSGGRDIAESMTGFILPKERHFLLRRQLDAGDYYIDVQGTYNYKTTRKNIPQSQQGPYAIHVDAVNEPGNTAATAARLTVGGVAGGRIASSGDEDYFRLDVSESTAVAIRAVAHATGIAGALLDSAGDPVKAAAYEETFNRAEKTSGFTMRRTLTAGTHYVKIAAAAGSGPGAYEIQAVDASVVPEDGSGNDLRARCRGFDATADEPLYGCQWNLDNTGQYGGTAGEDINMAGVGAEHRGEGVNVVVVDRGIDPYHEDLRGNFDQSLSYDYAHNTRIPDEFNPETFFVPSVADYHGTAVAGTIAARDNGRGLRGVAPRATVYGYNLLENDRNRTDDKEAHAMTHNLDVTAVQNNSWGPGDNYGWSTAPAVWERAVVRGVTEGYGGKGIVYTWAAGNGGEYDNSNYDEYANHYAVIAVCAVDHHGEQAPYSDPGANLWVCAPSSSCLGNECVSIASPADYSGYSDTYFGGTSAAAPTVAGVAALLRGADPSLTWRDVKLILAGSARENDTTDTGWDTGAAKYCTTNSADAYRFNHKYGFGVVDAGAAIGLLDGWTPLPEFTSETQTFTPEETLDVPYDGTSASSSVNIGAATENVEFVEAVELTVDMKTSKIRSLYIELESPSGEISKISDTPIKGQARYGYDGVYRFGSARHLGENPTGAWTLRIRDKDNKETTGDPVSQLRSWTLTVRGHRHAPLIGSTAVDTGKVTLFWSGPCTVGSPLSAVTAYDIRHIDSSASDKSDTNWTIINNAGGARTRGHTISGLTDGTEYDVQVRAVNAGGDKGSWSAAAVATPAAVTNAAPYFTEGDNTAGGNRTIRTVAENTASGRAVGSAVAAVDTDSDTLVYTLSGADADHFSIVSSSGQIQTASALDFETKSDYRVTVTVSDGKDGDGGSDTAVDDTVTVIVEVGDVEEAGTLSLSPSSVAAIPRVGQTVTAGLTDPDGGVTGTVWRWERSAGANAWTVISGAESDVYTPTSVDVGAYLRASVAYADARGSGKTAQAITGGTVQLPTPIRRTPVFTPPPPQPPPPPPPVPIDLFSDLGSAGVHETAVRALAAEAVLTDTGCGNGRLCPGEPLPRWEMAVWLVRILDGDDPAERSATDRRRRHRIAGAGDSAEPGTAGFTDVDPTAWWAPHVERLAELRITLGCSTIPARFCPHDTVTRSQTASFLTRAFKLRPPQRPPGFQDTHNRFNAAHIHALHAAGITKGCKAQPLLYCPARKTTRAQMASFLHRARN